MQNVGKKTTRKGGREKMHDVEEKEEENAGKMKRCKLRFQEVEEWEDRNLAIGR